MLPTVNGTTVAKQVYIPISACLLFRARYCFSSHYSCNTELTSAYISQQSFHSCRKIILPSDFPPILNFCQFCQLTTRNLFLFLQPPKLTNMRWSSLFTSQAAVSSALIATTLFTLSASAQDRTTEQGEAQITGKN